MESLILAVLVLIAGGLSDPFSCQVERRKRAVSSLTSSLLTLYSQHGGRLEMILELS